MILQLHYRRRILIKTKWKNVLFLWCFVYLIKVLAISRKQINPVFCEAGPWVAYGFSKPLWGIVEKHTQLKKILHLRYFTYFCSFLTCVDVYLDTLVEFHALKGKLKNLYSIIHTSSQRPKLMGGQLMKIEGQSPHERSVFCLLNMATFKKELPLRHRTGNQRTNNYQNGIE